uniref:hypothetical protein n=1 Tax=uncultured Caulobacter sp. TaxID=158749 RepID=UPI0025E83759|nr:hypothetical protein [uncultured Caulobacter sp.]
MSTPETEAFDVRVRDDGTIEINGSVAAHMLMRIALTAKFQTKPSAEMLLSSFVRKLVDAVLPATPYIPRIDWSDPGIIIPPAFLHVVEEMRDFQATHRPATPLVELVKEALHPYQAPLGRLGLAE